MKPLRFVALAGAAVALALLWGLLSSRGEAPVTGAPALERAASPRAGESSATDFAGRRDLSWDERLGGHTLARHVGRSDAELRRRLESEPGISAASSFPDRATAERVVASTLTDEKPRIERWLARGGGHLALDFAGRPGEIVGRTLARGGRAPRDTHAARVVLGRRGDAYVVVTAYPVEPR